MQLSDYPSEEINVLRNSVELLSSLYENQYNSGVRNPNSIGDQELVKMINYLTNWRNILREAAKEAHERETDWLPEKPNNL